MHTIILSFLLSAAQHFIQALIGAHVFQEIENLVNTQVNTTLTGDQKKQAVHDGLKAIQGDVGYSINNTAQWALNLGIETAVTTMNIKAGKTANNAG